MAQEPIDDITPNRWWLKPLLGLLALAALGFVGLKIYRRVEPDRLARRAREYMEKGDYLNATLTLRRALDVNPTNRTAMRQMAEMAERLQSPAALNWRRSLAELNPGNAEDALAWANSALRLKRSAMAKQALGSIPEKDRNTATYHAAAGGLAISEGRWKDAAKSYAEAARLAPADDLHRYNLATIQIQSPDAAERARGAATLEQLANSSRVQVFARRAVIVQLVRAEKWDEALQRSTELQQLPAVAFTDRITHLDLLDRAQKPELTDTLAATQKQAAANPVDAATMINWLRLHNRAADVPAYVATLEPRIAAEPIVLVARSEVLIVAKDWSALQALTENGDWHADEFRRRAFLSRALRETGNREGAKTQWERAIAEASQRDNAMQLAYLASTWDWQDELRAVLWACSTTTSPEWALRMLHGIYQGEGDTASMLRVSRRFVEAYPDDRAARNNVAVLSLLLDRDTPAAHKLAAELYQQAPDDPTIASTYALSLHLQSKSAEGRAVLEKLKPELLRTPGLAAYYAIVLSASGATAEARPYVELAANAPLLPEEKQLLKAAVKE